MKKFLTISLMYAAGMTFGQVGIGISNPTKGVMLEVASNDKGFLPPRLTTTQRDAIKPTPEALTIYNTTKKCIEYWNTTKWVEVGECLKDINPNPPDPDTSKNCTGWQIPYTDNGGSASGTVSNIAVTASFSNYKNIWKLSGDYCNIVLTDAFTLGYYSYPSSMVIKFNKEVSNMKVSQIGTNHGEKVRFIFKNKGVNVTPYIQILNTLCYGTVSINQAESSIAYNTSVSNADNADGIIYNLGKVWFDEVEIIHNGAYNGSSFSYCIGNAR